MYSRFGNATCLNFSKDFQKLFAPGQFKKNHEKLEKKNNKNFLLKFYASSDLREFFSRFLLFSKIVLLICSNITMLYITVPEIWSVI